MNNELNIKFESKEIKKNMIDIEERGFKKIEKEIQEDPYALYNALSALSFCKNIENIFFEIRRNNQDPIIMSKFVEERSYANTSIVGIFKVLEIINLSNQKLPDSNIEDKTKKWKILFFSIGNYISKIDLQNGINEEPHITSFNVSKPQLNMSDWIDEDFKKEKFNQLLKKDFQMLNKLLGNIENYVKSEISIIGAIAQSEPFISILNKFICDEKIPAEYLENIILDLDSNLIKEHRPGLSINNPIMKPLIKKDDKIFLSSILLNFSMESYFQIFQTCSIPFGLDVNKKERNKISREYSSIYSKKMTDVIEKITLESGYIIEQEVMSNKWNKTSDEDLGDIDAIIINHDLKVVLINEVKYKKKHFYNMASKYKTEKKWIIRQEERRVALKEYCEREFPKYNCYVNIITIDPIIYDSRLHYFNNITLNVLSALLKELKEEREVHLKKF